MPTSSDVHDLVVAGGGREHRPDGAPPVDEDGQRRPRCRIRRRCPDRRRRRGTAPSRDADCLGPRLRERRDRSTWPRSDAAGCRSGTAGCPAAAAGFRRAGTSGWSSRTCRSGSASSARPTKIGEAMYGTTTNRSTFIGGLPGTSASAAGLPVAALVDALGLTRAANGASPTCSSGGPSAASRRRRRARRRAAAAAWPTTESQHVAHGESASCSARRSSSSPARWSSSSGHRARGSAVAAYSSTTPRWSGSSASSSTQPGGR